MAVRSHNHYTTEALILIAFTKSISLGTVTEYTVLWFWNQFQVLLELIPRKLELVPRVIGTPPKIYEKTDFWNQFQILLETEPRVIGTENSSKITNNTWYHYQ